MQEEGQTKNGNEDDAGGSAWSITHNGVLDGTRLFRALIRSWHIE
jgi:hypothetical protein